MPRVKTILPTLLLPVAMATAFAETLTINVETEGPREGVIAILVFNTEKGFPDEPEKAFMKARFPVAAEGTTVCAVTNLPYGTYAVSVLHDINANYKSDKMLGLGPPKEPVGVSNAAGKLGGKPKFKQALFDFKAENNTIAVPVFYIF